MKSNYNLYPLRVFQILARAGRFTRAAEELGISQPAVSAQIQSLEKRFGQPLFERLSGGLRLTQTGTALLRETNLLLGQLEHVEAAVLGEPRGDVPLAASSTPGAYLLPARLSEFARSHPLLTPRMMITSSREVYRLIERTEASLGVVGEFPYHSRLELEKHLVATDELKLVVASNHPLAGQRRLTKERLATQTLILRPRGSSTREHAEAMLGDWFGCFERVLELASSEAIKESVLAGLGMAILSSWSTRREEEADLVRPVGGKQFVRERPFYLIRRAG
ncbi:LysR family transcriptional regulator, partial [bacterium CPR1]|nr:LysR family transcriptional regulator [bacterium CPR1]